MTAPQETAPSFRKPKPFESVFSEIPDVVELARIEAETSEMASTPEGKFVLTYLLATRNMLRPMLAEVHAQNDLLLESGKYDYMPLQNIDAVGTAIALDIASEKFHIPNLWIHTEASRDWAPARALDGTKETSDRFAVIDPLDMTSSIKRGDRVQTTGMAIYTKNGDLISSGIMSLVDDKFVFIEQNGGTMHVRTYPPDSAGTSDHDDSPIKFAAKTRRMHMLRELPIVTNGGRWVMDCDSGYAVLGLLHGNVDTVIDHVKGNPWHEVVIWLRAAQELGYPVSDARGNPIDIPSIMRRVIHNHEGDTFRVPFVMSRTPKIHETVLSLLKPEKNS